MSTFVNSRSALQPVSSLVRTSERFSPARRRSLACSPSASTAKRLSHNELRLHYPPEQPLTTPQSDARSRLSSTSLRSPPCTSVAGIPHTSSASPLAPHAEATYLSIAIARAESSRPIPIRSVRALPKVSAPAAFHLQRHRPGFSGHRTIAGETP